MKLYTIIGALLVSANFAHAELGDTYAKSCSRFAGARGDVDSVNKYISWYFEDANPGNQLKWKATEQFRNNRCVMIGYSYPGDVAEGGIWQLMSRNSNDNQVWHEYQDGIAGHRTFCTNDEKLFAAVWVASGVTYVRVAEKTWLERNGVLVHDAPKNDSTLPPVQEGAI
jgi:hypothetical protein